MKIARDKDLALRIYTIDALILSYTKVLTKITVVEETENSLLTWEHTACLVMLDKLCCITSLLLFLVFKGLMHGLLCKQ
jgi:hypothetical protein